jgi:hypothetical protein
MGSGFISDLQDPSASYSITVGIEADASVSLLAWSDSGIPVDIPFEISQNPDFLSADGVSADLMDMSNCDITVRPVPNENVTCLTADGVMDDATIEGTRGMAMGTSVPTPAMPMHTFAALMTNKVLVTPFMATPSAGSIEAHTADVGSSYSGAEDQMIFIGLNGAASAHNGSLATVPVIDPVTPASAPVATAGLADTAHGSSGVITAVGVGAGGATAAQVQQALDESGLSVNGTGIKVGVLSDSFNNLGGAATDEADGALPFASAVQVIKDLASGGTDEGRAMMQIIHDIAPGSSLAFYTAFDSEQNFANGILALASAGSKVIVDDVSYSDEPFFQNGVVAQAIQTVEAEGVTYVTAAGNDGSNGYQAAWSPISGTFDGHALTDAESFGGSLVQTVTINTEGTGDLVPLVLEWNQAYGAATSVLEILVFHNGSLVGTATNQTGGEPTNPWVEYDFAASGTYQIAIENLSGPNPGLIKEITEGNGLPATISGANSGTVVGHAMTPGAISAGAVSVAQTPAFGFSPALNESFSSSGAGTELLFANNGTALSSPDMLSPVTVSGVDDIATTVMGGLSDFYGTSAASASLAGVAALILSANHNLTPAQVEQIMEQTAAPMSNSGVSGAGLAQVDPAVAAAIALLIPTVIESFGSTKLIELGNTFALDSISGGTGPGLQYAGAAVVVGEFGTYMPIGAEQTATGYEVAWTVPGVNQYTVWNTDSNGDYVSNATGGDVPGSSVVLESLETSFHQDLNGDGVIGPPTTVIESFGSTKLVELGNTFALDSISSGTGPGLQYAGAAVVVGEFGTYTPIGAEQTATGYEVAWKVPGVNQYTVWNTDSNGDYVLNATGGDVPGSSIVLESLETSFHQDLNGDGVIGIPAGTGATSGVAATDAASKTVTGSILARGASSAISGQIVFENHTQENFKFISDDDGESIVYAQTEAGQSTLSNGDACSIEPAGNTASAALDTFAFASNFGHVAISSFTPAMDSIEISENVFAKIGDLLTTYGNVVITNAFHDRSTIQSVPPAQLQAHESDFHLI